MSALRKPLWVPPKRIIRHDRRVIPWHRGFARSPREMMAVAFDAKTTASSAFNTTSPINNNSLTIGTISNTVLIAWVVFNGQSIPAGTAVTWNGVALSSLGTPIADGTNNDILALYGLVNPATGNNTLSLSWTSGTNMGYLVGASFTGADQTGGVTTFANYTTNSNSSGNPTITVSSAVGDIVVSSLGTSDGVTITNGVLVFNGQTEFPDFSAVYSTAGSPSTTVSSSTFGPPWTACGCAIKAAGAGAVVPTLDIPRRRFLRR